MCRNFHVTESVSPTFVFGERCKQPESKSLLFSCKSCLQRQGQAHVTLLRVDVRFCSSSWLHSAAAAVASALREKINWLMATHRAGLNIVLGLCFNSSC